MRKIKDLLARAISLASEQPMSYKEAIELLDGIDSCKFHKNIIRYPTPF